MNLLDIIIVNHDEPIFLSIFLELIFYRPNNIINFLAKKFEKRFTCDFMAFLWLLHFLLLVDDLCYCRVMLLEIASGFAIVQIDEHVCKVGAKFVLSFVYLLLGLLLA